MGSNFSPGQNAEVFELPDSEALFLPSNMDSSQMAFKFKEVSPTPSRFSLNNDPVFSLGNPRVLITNTNSTWFNHIFYFPIFVP